MTNDDLTDQIEISRLLSKHVSEMRAFRREHGASVPGLMDAEDDYRNGGLIERFRAAIDAACRERPELEAQIRRLSAWAYCEDATDDLEG